MINYDEILNISPFSLDKLKKGKLLTERLIFMITMGWENKLVAYIWPMNMVIYMLVYFLT